MDNDTRRPESSLLGRWTDRPLAVDAVVAAVVLAVELVNLHREVTVVGYEPPLPVEAVAGWLLAVSIVLVWRRRRPLVVLAAVGVASAMYAVVDLPTLNLPLLVVVFTAGSVLRATAAVALALTAGIGAVNMLRGTFSQLPIDLVVFGAVWLLGLHLRLRREHATDLRRRQQAELWRARSQERTRLARELHDVVSNGVGGIYLQAVGAAGRFDEDPPQARAALERIQDSARSTLAELRSLLDVLRMEPDDPADGAGRRPTPSLRRLDDLLDHTRATGATLDVAIDGDLQQLPAGVSATGYRIVQEALGNAVRHGGHGPITLSLRVSDGLHVEVTNEAATSPRDQHGNGWGLTGMQERVDATGGRLRLVEEGDRFRLLAHLPSHGRRN